MLARMSARSSDTAICALRDSTYPRSKRLRGSIQSIVARIHGGTADRADGSGAQGKVTASSTSFQLVRELPHCFRAARRCVVLVLV